MLTLYVRRLSGFSCPPPSPHTHTHRYIHTHACRLPVHASTWGLPDAFISTDHSRLTDDNTLITPHADSTLMTVPVIIIIIIISLLQLIIPHPKEAVNGLPPFIFYQAVVLFPPSLTARSLHSPRALTRRHQRLTEPTIRPDKLSCKLGSSRPN